MSEEPLIFGSNEFIFEMDAPNRESDFVVAEHFIKKMGKTYFEKREATVYTKEEKTRRIDVQITRTIDQDKVVYVISRAGSKDSHILEQTDLSSDSLEAFKKDWSSNWKPILPKDESLTPLMLTICTLEPMTFRPQTEVNEESKDLKARISKLESSAAAENSRSDELAERAGMLDKMEKGELGAKENMLMKEEPVLNGPDKSADPEDLEKRVEVLETMMAAMKVKIDQLALSILKS